MIQFLKLRNKDHVMNIDHYPLSKVWDISKDHLEYNILHLKSLLNHIILKILTQVLYLHFSNILAEEVYGV